METSCGRPDRESGRPVFQALVLETLRGLPCGGGVERDRSATRVSRCVNVGRRCVPWVDGRRMTSRWLPQPSGLGNVDALRGGGTAQVTSVDPLLSSSRSVTISQRAHLCTTHTTPVPRFSWSKVLAGWGARGIKNQSATASLRLNRPLSGDRYELSVLRIPVLARVVVVYRLARESTGIDVSAGTNAGSAK